MRQTDTHTDTHTHTGALTHTRVQSIYYAGLSVLWWGGCIQMEGLSSVHYAGLCTVVGWVYCGGSDGTLGVHYAGLSVLWIACTVVEGGIEPRTYTAVRSVCCSGPIGVLSWRIWWSVGYIVVHYVYFDRVADGTVMDWVHCGRDTDI